MLDLPGFYFDEEKNRYFPLKARAAGPPPSQASGSSRTRKSRSPPAKPNRQNSFWRLSEKMSTLSSGYQQRSALRAVRASLYGQTSGSTLAEIELDPGANITCFSTFEQDPERQILGDSHGWIYNHALPSASDDNDISGMDLDLDPTKPLWQRDFGLMSPMSAIEISGQGYLATSFGPSPKVVIGRMNPDDTCFILTPPIADIRAASFNGRTAILGIRNRAWLLADVGSLQRGVPLETQQSDVLCVHREREEFFAGTRNGCVTLFDLRVSHQGQRILRPSHLSGHVGGAKSRAVDWTAVVRLKVVRDTSMIVSSMDGKLLMYDLRYLRKGFAGSKQRVDVPEPVLSFHGHVNQYREDLGLCVDNSFLYAAGQDRRLRGWSLTTGERIPGGEPSSTLALSEDSMALDSPLEPNPFRRLFDQPISALHVHGQKLWTASGKRLEYFELGKWQQPGGMYIDPV